MLSLRYGAVVGIAASVVAASGVSLITPLIATAQAPITEATPAPAASTPPPPAGLAGKVVTIDPGHNGGNGAHPTAINRLVDAGGGRRKACDTAGTQTADGRLSEHALTFDVARRLGRQLAASGARVVMTRTRDDGVGPCIDVRAKIGNTARSDVAISLHGDGGPPSGRGFHVIRPAGVTGQSSAVIADSDRFGRRVRTALRRKGYRPATYVGVDGLDRRNDLGGLNRSTVPKVIVELGNMRSRADAALMRRAAQRERMAAALADAIAVQLTH
jgi:N-acetylmuramoyl-L-alanine amidase